VLIIMTSGAGTTVTGVSDGTNSWARVVNREFRANAGGVEMWAAYNVAAGNTTVTASFSASVYYSMHLIEAGGFTTYGVFDASSVGQGNSTTPDSGNASITEDDEILIGIESHSVNESTTEDADFTTVETTATNFKSNSAYRIISSSGNYNYAPTLSGAGGDWVCEIAGFKNYVAPAKGQVIIINTN
jgi:hypothetical protein